jgi:hypothetical protein
VEGAFSNFLPGPGLQVIQNCSAALYLTYRTSLRFMYQQSLASSHDAPRWLGLLVGMSMIPQPRYKRAYHSLIPSFHLTPVFIITTVCSSAAAVVATVITNSSLPHDRRSVIGQAYKNVEPWAFGSKSETGSSDIGLAFAIFRLAHWKQQRWL